LVISHVSEDIKLHVGLITGEDIKLHMIVGIVGLITESFRDNNWWKAIAIIWGSISNSLKKNNEHE